MLSLTDALAKVKANCAPAVDPTLTDGEITAILADTAAAALWTANTAYATGQVVVPAAPLGRSFICVLPGTSGATEPPWLLAPAYTGPVNPLAGAAWWGVGVAPFIASIEGTPWAWGIADGTAAWRAFALFAGELYDVRAATRAAWILKAQKASSRVDTSIAGAGSRRDSQTPEFCMRMAATFAPMGFA